MITYGAHLIVRVGKTLSMELTHEGGGDGDPVDVDGLSIPIVTVEERGIASNLERCNATALWFTGPQPRFSGSSARGHSAMPTGSLHPARIHGSLSQGFFESLLGLRCSS